MSWRNFFFADRASRASDRYPAIYYEDIGKAIAAQILSPRRSFSIMPAAQRQPLRSSPNIARRPISTIPHRRCRRSCVNVMRPIKGQNSNRGAGQGVAGWNARHGFVQWSASIPNVGAMHGSGRFRRGEIAAEWPAHRRRCHPAACRPAERFMGARRICVSRRLPACGFARGTVRARGRFGATFR